MDYFFLPYHRENRFQSDYNRLKNMEYDATDNTVEYLGKVESLLKH